MPRTKLTRQQVLAVAEVTEEELPTASDFDGALPPDLEFDPVPRASRRRDGWSPEKQRAFIFMLAQCGSVRLACRAAGSKSNNTVYALRHSPGSESFSAAWDKAVKRGARRVLDVLVDQSINGTPVKLYRDGVVVAERREYNTRAMMWIVAHNLPDQYGVPGGLMHGSGTPVNMKRIRDRWRKEWEEERRQGYWKDENKTIEEISRKINAIRAHFKHCLAPDPEKRAAWELLTGETDWSDFDKVTDYGWGPPETNQNRPDIIVANAMGMDALYGMRGNTPGAEADREEEA